MPLDTLNPATLMSGRFRSEQIPDLTGRVAFVTGGSAGIGYYAALALARAGARVHIAGATAEHGEAAEREMNEYLQENRLQGAVTWHEVDLGDLKATDALAQKIAKESRLDILICNAGIGQGPQGSTSDGVPNHYGVNNLSHFVITNRLIPLMLATAKHAPPTSVRIVMQSSELHRMAPSDVEFSSIAEVREKSAKDPTMAYGLSKLGNILLGRQLVARRLGGGTNVLVTSVHPGTVDTDVQETWTESYGFLGTMTNGLMRLLGKSAPEGAEACLWAATATDINAVNAAEYQGNYYTEPYGKPHTESSQAQDERLGDAFWTLSTAQAKELLGQDVTV